MYRNLRRASLMSELDNDKNMSDNNRTMKKRKANNGRATVPDSGDGGLFSSSSLGNFSGRNGDGTSPTAASSTCHGESLTQQMDAMLQMMIRMEERQQATVSNLFRMEERQLTIVRSLKSRCKGLESKCLALENTLDDMRESQRRQSEYNNMLLKNLSWKYSTPVHSAEYWKNNGHDEYVAKFLSESSECLKYRTEKMRRGEFIFPDCARKGIGLDWELDEIILDPAAMKQMLPHWEEFAAALKQCTPVFDVLPDDGRETYFTLKYIQLPEDVQVLLKDALMNKPFQSLSFANDDDAEDDEGMSVDDIMDIVKSNKHLRKLSIGNNRIQLGHIKTICSAVRYRSIVELDLDYCFENGVGDELIISLLKNGGLAKLQSLRFVYNGIAPRTITKLANFLATNPLMWQLDLEGNCLGDNDAKALANALRSNTSLRCLCLYENDISDAGDKAFDRVVHGDGNLNSIADSNHSCNVVGDKRQYNRLAFCDMRAKKIYGLLSKRNKSMSTSNVQYFHGIDVNILPLMLKAVERYSSAVYEYRGRSTGYCSAEPLSIVYEVMRKWDKVFPLYTVGGGGSIDK